jgi:hypothetical protein
MGKSQLGAPPGDAFLNRAFWCQHHFKPKKRDYFWRSFLIAERSPWVTHPLMGDPNFNASIIRRAITTHPIALLHRNCK